MNSLIPRISSSSIQKPHQAKPNSKRLDAKHIKHNAPQIKPLDNSTIHIKSSTPYISAIKRVSKTITQLQDSNQKKFNNVSIKGMGKSISKTLSIALHFQSLSHKVETFTGSVEVLDEFKINKSKRKISILEESDESESEDETVYKKRMVSYIECKIHFK